MPPSISSEFILLDMSHRSPVLLDHEVKYIVDGLNSDGHSVSVKDLKIFSGWLSYFQLAVADSLENSLAPCPIVFLAVRAGHLAPQFDTGQLILGGLLGEMVEVSSRPVLPFLGGIQVDSLSTFTPSQTNGAITWLYNMQRVLEEGTPDEANTRNMRGWISELAHSPSQYHMGVAEGHLITPSAASVACFGWWRNS